MRESFDYAEIGKHCTCPNCKQDFINDSYEHILCKHCSSHVLSGFFRFNRWRWFPHWDAHLGIVYCHWFFFVFWHHGGVK